MYFGGTIIPIPCFWHTALKWTVENMNLLPFALSCALIVAHTKKKFLKSKEPVKEKPHIVFILADDLGWNEVSSS